MKVRRGALPEIARLLRGQACTPRDWTDLVGLANVTLLSPALFAALSADPALAHPPAAVMDYLAFVHERNTARNRAMKRMAQDVVRLLNEAGIVPALLKGAAVIMTAPDTEIGDRITSDVDMSVAPDDIALAEAALIRAGFAMVPAGRGLARAGDPALVELRGHYPGLEQQTRVFGAERIRAGIPTETAMFLHWMVHDLLKEGDIQRGRIDLRHLHDLARLSRGGQVDGRRVREAMAARGGAMAFDVQMLALARYFDAALPGLGPPSPAAWLHHWRRVVAVENDWLGAPVRLAGTSSWALSKVWQQRSWTGLAHLLRRHATMRAGEANGTKL